ncbi:hypothetical protein LDO31_01830 [Luteimonas sp. XNQY3]|nr:hypothetical protein [Luteimonas sp. XNQY3]MCD9004991.1 hypothetical protein [Luteimonas sp. XNQY3]
MHRLIPWFLAGLLTCVPTLSVQASPQALALDRVRIVDVEHGRSGEPRCVRIKHGRVAHIARAGTAPADAVPRSSTSRTVT